jgi:drug/metabolite transporter (DMT)-like permease
MAIDWIGSTVLSAAIFSLVHILDSHLVSRRMPSFKSFLLTVGILIFSTCIVMSFLFPLPPNVGIWPLSMAVMAGITRTTSVFIMLYSMKREDVSLIIPITSTYPIFVALLAIPILGEIITSIQWLAVVLVVFGVLFASIRFHTGAQITWLGKSLTLLIASSFLYGISDVITKYALEYVTFWNMYWISQLTISLLFFSISLRLSVIRELINFKRRNSSILIAIISVMISLPSFLLLYWSMQRGPISLVSAIYSIRPLFVLLYAVVISRLSSFLLEEQTSGLTLLLRFVSIILIVCGIVIIYSTK